MVYKMNYLLFVFSASLLMLSCNVNEKDRDPEDPESYIEVTSDSLGNRLEMTNHRFYMWRYDTSRKMLKGYWENGQLQSISYYYKEEKTGKWTGYFDDGKISFEANYYKGQKNGAYKIYYPNGNIYIIENYSAGKPSGTWLYYDTLNNVIKKEEYNVK